MRKLKTTATPSVQAIYTTEQARAILQIGRNAIVRLCRSGELHSITIGRSRRIPAQAIDEFIASRLALADAAGVTHE
jgi:excisionase family DNA binding protein